MDFSLLLVVAVAVTGLVWLLDSLIWARGRRARVAAVEAETGEQLDESARKRVAREPWVVDYARSFFPVLLVVLLLRSFLVEPFQIPSGSMRPTLEVGDFILVNKYTYGLRLPVLNTRFVEMNDPERGDVMVFRFPQEPSINFIKRVVGLPGDQIRYEGKQLYVNGEAVPNSVTDESPSGASALQLLEEQLGERLHYIYHNPQDPGPQMRELVVPDGHYFTVGDNRDNSNDSRYWGFVPEENIVGQAFAVWMHWDGGLPSFTSVRRIQ
ncbi:MULTISPECIES: signal peptidase I [Halomonadaceae]|uniref:signal peptidase I n=1 Tax=Halomonadaceae TaxID=28256 RepID=UPI001599A822|nr:MULTISPECIES: signal peptidase I [Halomonas]QJQ94722.1 signal peptidase I [Halomonas sp. PA5]